MHDKLRRRGAAALHRLTSGNALSIGARFLVAAVVFVVACTGDGPTGPSSSSVRLAFDAHFVFVGAKNSDPINYIRAIVYDAGTGARIASLEQPLDPAKNSFDFQLPIPLVGGATTTRMTLELANRGSTGAVGEIVQYSGRKFDIRVAPGDFRQIDIDLYPGPLDNLDVTGVHITKPLPARLEGLTYQAAATVDGGGSGVRIIWSSLDTATAKVTEAGSITGALPGTARIVAAVGTHADTAAIQILQRAAAITITPSSVDLDRGGDTAVFVAKVVDPRGAAIVGDSVVYSLTNTAIASSVGWGKYEAQATGQTTVNASFVVDPSTTLTNTATLNVKNGARRVGSLTITPADTTLKALGATATYSVVAKDVTGKTLTGATIAWTSSVLGAATVSSSGIATAVGAGTTTITAKSDTATASARLVVVPTAATLAISSGDAQTGVVGTALASAIAVKATDARGNPVAGTTVTFASGHRQCGWNGDRNNRR
jgi:hypothetical protein